MSNKMFHLVANTSVPATPPQPAAPFQQLASAPATLARMHPDITQFLAQQESQRRIAQQVLRFYSALDTLPQPLPTSDELVSVEFVTRSLQVSERTIRRWAQQGWLHRVRVGKRTLFLREQVEAILLARVNTL